MSDCYAWIDPWQEMERSRVWANASYRRGQDDAVRHFEDATQGKWVEAVDFAVASLADRLARQVVEPFLKSHRPDYEQYQRKLELEIETLSLLAKPLVVYAQREGELQIMPQERMDTGQSEVIFSVVSATPFRFNVAMCAPRDRYRW